MKFKLSIVFLISVISACANYPSRFNPENISILDLASIRMERLPFLHVAYAPTIVSVINENNEEVIKTGFGKSRHFDVQLVEGSYYVVLRCDDTYSYGFPGVVVSLEKGKNYTAYCRSKKVDGEYVGIEGFIFEDSQPAPPRK